MSQHNPELQAPPVHHPDEAIQPNAPDFVETPDATPPRDGHEPLPVWIYLVCGLALFLAGSSFTGFSTFGLGLYDQGQGGPSTGTGNKSVAAAPATPMDLGKKVYNNNCASCHQPGGDGQPGKYPPMIGSEYVLGSKERLAGIMLHGLSGSVTVHGGTYNGFVMAAWDGSLTNDQIANVMTYIRGSWGNTAGPVTADEVAAAKTKFASQSGPYCEADLLKIAPHGPDPTDKK